LAECLVLKTEELFDENNTVRERVIYYYEHYTIFNDMFFWETEPRTVAAPAEICVDLEVFPGIYELAFSEEEEEQPCLLSIRFIKPGDMWEEAQTKE
jgi:hypothetical protein